MNERSGGFSSEYTCSEKSNSKNRSSDNSRCKLCGCQDPVSWNEKALGGMTLMWTFLILATLISKWEEMKGMFEDVGPIPMDGKVQPNLEAEKQKQVILIFLKIGGTMRL